MRGIAAAHAHAVEISREGISLVVIQRQLGQHDDPAMTSRYLRGIDNTEIIKLSISYPNQSEKERREDWFRVQQQRVLSVGRLETCLRYGSRPSATV